MAAFDYIISITGDCSLTSSGVISILPEGGTPPYTVEWVDPALGTDIVTLLPSIRSGLGEGTYGLRLNDSTLPINEEFYVNIPISSGVCSDVLGVGNTTCDLENGSVTGSSSSNYSSTNFYLYTSANTYITSATTNTNQAVFDSLSAGTYYLVTQDLGGCTGRSETFIIQESTPFTYGLYVVPNSSCGGDPIGKIYVTGQTGSSPYEYQWSNGQTGNTITGLTSGAYTVTVTDATGCEVSQTGIIGDVDPVGLGVFTVVNPSCLESNGSITMIITGGTAPYYYSASTGYFEISYSQTFTLSNLSAGQYNFQVTDAGFCTFFAGTTLDTPEGIASISISSTSSSCNVDDGKITVSVVGGTAPYTYLLIYPDASTESTTGSQTSYVFDNLSYGTYTVGVSDNSGCSLLQEVTIITENLYTIATTATGTTCNQSNGSIQIIKSSGGTSPFDYSLDGVVKFLNTTLSAVTISNVSSGQHTVSITDALGCVQTKQVFVPASSQLNFSIISTSCGSGSEGTISAFISSGTPPFTYNWSSNVPGNPQNVEVTGLSGGTYTLTITDSTGCSLQRSTTISCNPTYTSYQCYTMGSESIQIQSPSKRGLLQMLNEGFFDLTSGNTNCILVSADFIAQVSIQPLGTVLTQNFYTSTVLNQIPSDNLWYDTIKTMLLSVLGVGGVTIDPINNQITITKSTTNNSLDNQDIIIELKIVYDTMCQS